MKKTSLILNSSLQGMKNSGAGINQVSRDSKWSLSSGGFQQRKGKTKGHGGNGQPPRRAVRVLDEDGNDVTPQPLNPAVAGDVQPKPGNFFIDEIFSSSGSDHLRSTSFVHLPSSLLGSSPTSSLSNKASLTMSCFSEEQILEQTKTVKPDVKVKRDNVKQRVTEEMLDEDVDICLSETESISLLDLPSTVVSEDADDAKIIKERNIHYAELCKNRMGNDKFVERSMESFSGAPKSKQIQCDEIVMVDKGTTASVWDIYDSFCNQNKSTKSEIVNYSESTLNTSKVQEEKEGMSNTNTFGKGSTSSSVLGMEISGNGLNVEPDAQQIMLSESFQHSLLVMERNIVANTFQHKLAAYRQLPIRRDPDSTVKPGTEERSEEAEMTGLTPALERLWAFSCEFARGRNVTSMAWNKMNPDILAVGYDDCDSGNQKPGLICCWSLKNLMCPERVFHCHSCVTSLDFSADNPGQLAVGMHDGTVALYNVQCLDSRACFVSSSECSKKHLHPVWQVKWTKQQIIQGEEGIEVLLSVSADGRITKWLLYGNGFDCIDLMKLKKRQKTKEEEEEEEEQEEALKKKKEAPKKEEGSKKKTKKAKVTTLVPGLCIDFHPNETSNYLVGTWDGFIYKCTLSNSQNFLDTYQKHICPVNRVEWSPFSPDVFLSCSSDWTIQLWKQDRPSPVLSFISTQTEVYTVKWSPNYSTVFAAINDHGVEIWDLNSSILYPTIVHHAAPGVKMTALLFSRGTNCVLVGDSVGQVTVYKLKNLNVGEGEQVDSLDDIVQSIIARGQKTDVNL